MSLQQTLFDTQAEAIRTRRDDAPLTPWIVERLIRSGAMTETGLTRRARPRPCPTCGTWTVCGLDADTLALEARCDVTPLTALGEVLVLATGRRTVELIHTRGRLQLEQRWADHIEGRPAGGLPGLSPYDVLAEHRCGQPIPPAYAAQTVHQPPSTTTRETQEPGF